MSKQNKLSEVEGNYRKWTENGKIIKSCDDN